MAGVSSVSVSVGDSSLNVGETTSATATATYSDGETEQVNPSWSSSDTNIASVNSSGTITGVGEGSADITGTYNDQSGSVTVDVTAVTWYIQVWMDNLIHGGWLEGATVDLGPPGNTATTNEDGYAVFSCTETSPGSCNVGAIDFQAEKSGYLTTKNQISVTSEVTQGRHGLIPNDNIKFDLGFFDNVWRDNGSHGIKQWITNPTIQVQIWNQDFQCLVPNGMECESFIALGTVPSNFESIARTVTADYVPLLTGQMRNANIQTITKPVGTVMSDSCWAISPATVVIVMVDMGDNSGEAGRSYTMSCQSDTAILSALVIMKPGADGYTVGHEIGHVVGMSHPDGYPAVPKPSVMKDDDTGISDWDQYSGFVNYKHRTPGYTSPDTAPSGATINLFDAARSPFQTGGSEWIPVSPFEISRLVGIGVMPPLTQPWSEPVGRTPLPVISRGPLVEEKTH